MSNEMFGPGTPEQLARQWQELEDDKQEALTRIRSEKFNYKEGWKKATLTCRNCSKNDAVVYDPDRAKRHERGALVQDVWAEAPLAYREKMIGLRTGMWICETCWENIG